MHLHVFNVTSALFKKIPFYLLNFDFYYFIFFCVYKYCKIGLIVLVINNFSYIQKKYKKH